MAAVLSMVVSLLCITLHMVPSDGQYVYLTGSALNAVAGDPFTFYCRSSYMNSVQWNIQLNNNPEIIQVTALNDDTCSGVDPYKSVYNFTCRQDNRLYTLTILKVDYQTHHGSNWTCTDMNGGYQSNTVLLQVNVPLKRVEINSTANPVTVTEGDTLRVECTTNPTRPTSTILWSKDGDNVTEGVATDSVEDDGRTVTVSMLSFTVTCADHLRGVRCTGVYGGQRVTSSQLGLFVHCKAGPGFGAGVGTGFVVCLVLLAVTVGVILLYMWRRHGKNDALSTWAIGFFTDLKKNLNPHNRDDGVPRPNSDGNQGVCRKTPKIYKDLRSENIGPHHVYEGIDHSTRQVNIRDTYEELGIRENKEPPVP